MSEGNKASLLERWETKLANIVDMFDDILIKVPNDNTHFVHQVLKIANTDRLTKDQYNELVAKRDIMLEICDDIDAFHRKLANVQKAINLDKWFEEEVRAFTNSTIPDANVEDERDILEHIEKMQEDEIEIKTKMLEAGFSQQRKVESVGKEEEI